MRHSMLLLTIALLVTTGCGSARHHTLMRDESGLSELAGTFGVTKVTIHSVGGVYRDVEITSVSPDLLKFKGKHGLGSVQTKTVFMIVKEKSGRGIIWGAVGGLIGGIMIGAAVSGSPGDGLEGTVGSGFLCAFLGGGIGLTVGGVIGNTIDQDEVYTLKEPKK